MKIVRLNRVEKIAIAAISILFFVVLFSQGESTLTLVNAKSADGMIRQEIKMLQQNGYSIPSISQSEFIPGAIPVVIPGKGIIWVKENEGKMLSEEEAKWLGWYRPREMFGKYIQTATGVVVRASTKRKCSEIPMPVTSVNTEWVLKNLKPINIGKVSS